MFAIIDIETTGLDPKKDKITEIAIVLHDGLGITEQFSTLIDPQRSIPQHISRITGINNEMVKGQPRFFEVAKKILDLTRDRIFVAHNVEFDFRFIEEEFKSLGYPYKREKLCTVRLSRKLLPKRYSYSLGKLCESLQIPLLNAHRAAADAYATAQLFSYLMQLKSAHPLYKYQDIHALNTGRVQKIQQYILAKLPERIGVYKFYNRQHELIYIGKSTNLRQRAIQHYNSKEKKTRQMIAEIHNVEFEETGTELIALLLESEEIKRHQPKYNRARRKNAFAYAIDTFFDDKGIRNFKIVPTAEAAFPLRLFHTWISARSVLNEGMDHAGICPKFCGLYEHEGPCFNHQIRKCSGICCGKEEIDRYNQATEEWMNRFGVNNETRVIWGEGRSESEKSFVLVYHGKFSGYGYLNRELEMNNPDDLLQRVVPFDYYPDADDLILAFEKKKENAEIKNSVHHD